MIIALNAQKVEWNYELINLQGILNERQREKYLVDYEGFIEVCLAKTPNTLQWRSSQLVFGVENQQNE